VFRSHTVNLAHFIEPDVCVRLTQFAFYVLVSMRTLCLFGTNKFYVTRLRACDLYSETEPPCAQCCCLLYMTLYHTYLHGRSEADSWNVFQILRLAELQQPREILTTPCSSARSCSHNLQCRYPCATPTGQVCNTCTQQRDSLHSQN
jgi:hypothetical protein